MTGAEPPEEVARAVAELWRVQPLGPDSLFSSPEFVRLKEALQSLHTEIGNPEF